MGWEGGGGKKTKPKKTVDLCLFTHQAFPLCARPLWENSVTLSTRSGLFSGRSGGAAAGTSVEGGVEGRVGGK